MPRAATLMSKQGKVGYNLKKLPGAVYATLFMFLLLSIISEGFLTSYNLLGVMTQGSMLLIVSLGMTVIILSEGIDLSLGAVLSLAGVIMTLLLQKGSGLIVAGTATIICGAACGLLTGLLICKVKLPPFVATFGTMGIAQGIALVLTAGSSVSNENLFLQELANNEFLLIPIPVWIVIFVFMLVYALLYYTRFGAYVFAIGGNEEATRLSGVAVDFYKTMIYVHGGVLAAVAAFIMVGRLNAGHPTVALGLEFDAIAAVIIGGTSFEKGNGGLLGTVIGVVMISVLRNGLNLLGIDPFVQLPLIGTIIIASIVWSSKK